MRTIGIIGGIGPESTADYYRLIIAGYRTRKADGSYPSILINSIDLQKMLLLVGANRLDDLTAFLLQEIRRLAAAGADFGLLASNTPHIVFDALSAASPIPLLSIVDAACRSAAALGLQRLGLLGTRFTMQGPFYPAAFRAAGMELLTPHGAELDFVHDKYMSELVPGRFLPETRDAFLAIIQRLRAEEEIDGLILAGTELPLLLREVADPGVPLLDTTQLHVDLAVQQLLA